jgi:hypothetical protein
MISVRLTDSVGRLVAGRRADSRATAWTSLRPCHSSRQSRSLPGFRKAVNKCNRLFGDNARRSPHRSEWAVRAQQSSIAARGDAR